MESVTATDGGGRRALIVDDDGKLVGIVTPSDVTRALTHASLRAG